MANRFNDIFSTQIKDVTSNILNQYEELLIAGLVKKYPMIMKSEVRKVIESTKKDFIYQGTNSVLQVVRPKIYIILEYSNTLHAIVSDPSLYDQVSKTMDELNKSCKKKIVSARALTCGQGWVILDKVNLDQVQQWLTDSNLEYQTMIKNEYLSSLNQKKAPPIPPSPIQDNLSSMVLSTPKKKPKTSKKPKKKEIDAPASPNTLIIVSEPED